MLFHHNRATYILNLFIVSQKYQQENCYSTEFLFSSTVKILPLPIPNLDCVLLNAQAVLMCQRQSLSLTSFLFTCLRRQIDWGF